MSKIQRLIEADRKKSPQLDKLYEIEEAKFDIAKMVLSLRKESGLNQSQFAKLVGKSRSTISRIEKGEMEPSFSTLIDITSALNKRLTFSLQDLPKKI